MLIKRIITGLVLGLLAIAGIFYLPPVGFSIVAGIIVGIAAWEFATLFWPGNFWRRGIFMLVLALFYGASLWGPTQPILLIGSLWWLIAPYFLWRYSKHGEPIAINFPVLMVMGVLIFIPCAVGLVAIKEDFGPEYLFFVLAIVWATDIGAFFSGKWWGKNKLASKISPKKTREGLYGGIVAALVVAIAGGLLLRFSGILWLLMMTLVVVTSLWSVIGDLFESMLKRQARAKDSGNLLPGHGGMYDRIDSLTAAIPIFVLGLLIL